jgi:large subunit ribosomal protein L4
VELPVKSVKGEVVGSLEARDSLFAVAMNPAVVHQALVTYQANRRQGTHDTKTRGEVSGGGIKPWRQKYTGRARQGSIRSPQWRHGGIVFGPHPRDYRLDLPRKMRHLALRCVLSEKVRQGKLIVLESLELPSAKTRTVLEMLEDLGVGSSVLMVTRGPEPRLIQACQNLKRVYTLPARLLNAGILLEKDTVIMTSDAVKQAEELWAEERSHKQAAAEVTT